MSIADWVRTHIKPPSPMILLPPYFHLVVATSILALVFMPLIGFWYLLTLYVFADTLLLKSIILFFLLFLLVHELSAPILLAKAIRKRATDPSIAARSLRVVFALLYCPILILVLSVLWSQ